MNVNRIILCCALSLCLAAFSPDQAAAFPDKPVNYIIPFNPGGESDIFARAQQPLLEKELGQPLLISYKTGNGGSAGLEEMIRSEPDGYNVAAFSLPHIILQPLQRKTPGFQTREIEPVMIFMNTPDILAVPHDSPYKTLQEFLDAAKAGPGALTLGGSDAGSANHLGVMRLNRLAGVNISYVPFAGTGDAMPAFLGGRVTGLMTYTTMGVQYRNDMRVLAVAAERRFSTLPDAPTFREQGYDLVGGAYRGLAVPPNTPKTRVDVLYNACAKVNADPEFVKKMEEMGFLLENLDPAASVALIDKLDAAYRAVLGKLEK